VNKSGKEPTPLQMLGIGAVIAVAFGAHVFRQASRSPAERAKSDEDRRRRHAENRAYEVRWKKAWELDRAHWKSFEANERAQARFEAEYYVPVDAAPAAATVERFVSGSFWDITESYRVVCGDDVLTFWHHRDGGYLGLKLDSPIGQYKCGVGAPDGRLTIGECDGVPSALQHRAAALIGAMQAEGHFADRQICAVLPDKQAVLNRHYAEYARERGWPPERNGEADRVQRAHYASERG
jgi:hypothetical protein